MYRTLDDGIELTAAAGRARVRLLAPQHPHADVLVAFRIELQDQGLTAATEVTTIGGDRLAPFAKSLADAYAGWDGE